MRTQHLALAFILCAAPALAQSYYTVRLEDPKAVYIDATGAKGDGVADDTAAIQAAIDRVQETTGHGIVFVPEGRYRITRTLNVWPSIRLIGYGRPAAGLRPGRPHAGVSGSRGRELHRVLRRLAARRSGRRREGQRRAGRPPDANPGTFYSAMSNIDIEIGAGNAAAVGVRGTYAQHCFLAHMDFRIGPGIAGVHDIGNEVEDVHFLGGQYGIWTRTPSPSWQFWRSTLLRGPARGGHPREGGGTHAGPAALPEGPDGRVHRRRQSRRTLDQGRPHGGRLGPRGGHQPRGRTRRTQINLENVVCRDVPIFARFRESGKTIAGPGAMYEARAFSHGLHFADIGAAARDEDRLRRGAAHRPAAAPRHRISCRCRRRARGSTSGRSARRATARPTTRRPSGRRSPSTARSTCRRGTT